MKRYILTLILALVLLALTSCSLIVLSDREDALDTSVDTEETTGGAEQTIVPEETTDDGVVRLPLDGDEAYGQAASYLNALPVRDLGDVGIVIATTDADTYAPTSSSAVSAARIERNRMVEQKYNTRIVVNQRTAAELYSEVREAVKAGMYYADIIAIPQRTLGLFQANSLLMNMHSLPYTSYGADYYDHDAIEQMSAMHDTFAVSGAASQNRDFCYAVFFNKDVAEDHSLDLYTQALGGEWTWDALVSAVKTVSSDLNGGIYGYAYNTTLSGFIDTAFASSGERYVTTGAGLVPKVTYSGERAESMVSFLSALIGDSSLVYPEISDEDQSRASGGFYGGDVMFYIYRLGASSWFKNMESDWGILPLPKLDTAQEGYSTYVDPDATVLAVIKNNSNTESTGMILQALNAASYGHVEEAYYTDKINNVLRDNSSALMLDLIIEGSRFDFANMFAVSYGKLENATRFAVRSAVKLGTTVEQAYGYHASSAQNELAAAFGE